MFWQRATRAYPDGGGGGGGGSDKPPGLFITQIVDTVQQAQDVLDSLHKQGVTETRIVVLAYKDNH